MAGDVNLYWNDDDAAAVEIEVMVAEAASRRRGVAREALGMLQAHAVARLGVRLFRAKIGFDNAASLALFAALGYREVSRSEVFREATLELAAAHAGGPELDYGEYD
jgi:RimJ/RimL family protein N-acetyltransferase